MKAADFNSAPKKPVRDARLTAINFVSDAINRTLELREIAGNALDAVLAVTGLDAGSVHIWEDTENTLRLFVTRGVPESVAGQVARLRKGNDITIDQVLAGETKVIEDFCRGPRFLEGIAVEAGFHGAVLCPIRARGGVVGMLGLGTRQPRAFHDADVELIEVIANQIGVALANAQLYEAQKRENEKLTALVDISARGPEELAELLQLILHRSAALLKADGALLVRYEGERSEFVAATPRFGELVGVSFPIQEDLSGQVRRIKRGQIFTREEVMRYSHSQVLARADIRSVVVVPLFSRGQPIGTLSLLREASAPADFEPTDLELLGAFAGRAAVAIDNSQLLKDLREKNDLLEVLIEEAHHRIKNNLQMITGLLQLESQSVGADHTRVGLRSAISRIQAIAQVHNLLSQDMPRHVDIHKLINAILDTFRAAARDADNPPSVSVELDTLWLDADQAVALALVVNELASNSLQHGRPPVGQSLSVRVWCRQQAGEIRLRFCDNGGGLPSESDWQKLPGHGLKIINQLARVNLRGTMQVGTRDGGLCAELWFRNASQTAASSET